MSEISKITLSGFLGLLCAEQHVGNLKKMRVQEFWESGAQNKKSEISSDALSGILGLLCAEQSVRRLQQCYPNLGISVRRTKRPKAQQLYFHKLWDTCAQNKASEISNMHFHRLWDSHAQNKTSETLNMHFHKLWDSCAQNKTSETSTTCTFINSGILCAEQHVGNIKNVSSGILGLRCAEQNVEHLKT